VGYREQPFFLNAVCCITTELSPFELLALADETEKALGRTPSFPNGPRLIDLDILFYGDRVIETPQLIIPHPRLIERAFVLVPLAEVAPHLVHPILRVTIEELAARVNGLSGVRKVGPWHKNREKIG
jgi:7,8-dihydro-6-hydroxymethylpterin-pyrophosphokinase